jgi:hypothetical protein
VVGNRAEAAAAGVDGHAVGAGAAGAAVPRGARCWRGRGLGKLEKRGVSERWFGSFGFAPPHTKLKAQG